MKKRHDRERREIWDSQSKKQSGLFHDFNFVSLDWLYYWSSGVHVSEPLLIGKKLCAMMEVNFIVLSQGLLARNT